MINRIPGASPLTQTYGPRPTLRPQAPTATPEASEARATTPSAPDLSTDEQAAITRNFPPNESVALRLYGPGRGVQTLNPQGLGGRLDLRG